MEPLTSLQNPKVKLAQKLWDRRTREKEQKFLIEGYRELSRAVVGKQPILTLFICPDLFLGTNEPQLIDKIREQGGFVVNCSEKVFKSFSYRDRPDGLLGIGTMQHLTLDDLKLAQNPFIVVAESIEKPGNLGTILRSSDAAGVDCVIVADPCTDIFNPNVVRASVGTLFTLPVVQAPSDLVLEWLKRNHIKIVAATPAAREEFTEADLTGPVAIAVGTEQTGLKDLWKERSDINVKIPMHGVADSLNVAVATTLLLYEVRRQRA